MDINAFRQRFSELTEGWDWEVEGFIDKNNNVYPIDTDTKVISTVFERLSSPVLRSIAKDSGYRVETANQTTYPDFTMDKDGSRIAIDIKTTYRSRSMVMTLGGYNSFLRDDTKNILYPYSTYNDHWIIGFVYDRNAAFREYDLDNLPNRGTIPCPYGNVSYFVGEKHALSGIRAGSGNTKNIGSVKVSAVEEFAVGGPFSAFEHGKAACDYYWINYERLSQEIASAAALSAHPEFSRFKPRAP